MRGPNDINRTRRGVNPPRPDCPIMGRIGDRSKISGRGRSEPGNRPSLAPDFAWKNIGIPLSSSFNRKLEIGPETALIRKTEGSKSISLVIDSRNDGQRLVIGLDLKTGKVTNSLTSIYRHEEIRARSSDRVLPSMLSNVLANPVMEGNAVEAKGMLLEREPRVSWVIKYPAHVDAPSTDYSRSIITLNRWTSCILKDLEGRKASGEVDQFLDKDLRLISRLFKDLSMNLKFLTSF
jgi:hypothetical protein